jgi:hypothetical protein
VDSKTKFFLGHSVLYPQNAMKAHYEELLLADDLRLDSFKNKIK